LLQCGFAFPGLQRDYVSSSMSVSSSSRPNT
jgi:hypothetical protein